MRRREEEAASGALECALVPCRLLRLLVTRGTQPPSHALCHQNHETAAHCCWTRVSKPWGTLLCYFFNFSCPPTWPPPAPCVCGAWEHFLVDVCHSTERRIHRLAASLECCLHFCEEGELLPTPQRHYWGSRDSSALPFLHRA